MPRTKDKKRLVVVQKAMPYLYIATSELKKSGPLYIGKSGGLPSMSNFVSLKNPGSKAPGSDKPKPPTVSMGHAPKPAAPKLPGLNARGMAALDAVPNKSVTSKEDDEGDE